MTKGEPVIKKTPTEIILWMLKRYEKEVNLDTVEKHLSQMRMAPYKEIIQVMKLFDPRMQYKQIALYNDNDYNIYHRFVDCRNDSYNEAVDIYNHTNINLSDKFWLYFIQKLEKRFDLKHEKITIKNKEEFDREDFVCGEQECARFEMVDNKEYFFVWFDADFCFPVENSKQRKIFENIKFAINAIFDRDCSRYLPSDFKL